MSITVATQSPEMLKLVTAGPGDRRGHRETAQVRGGTPAQLKMRFRRNFASITSLMMSGTFHVDHSRDCDPEMLKLVTRLGPGLANCDINRAGVTSLTF